MRVITNEPLIAKRKRWASILSPISMVLLLGGLVLNFWVGRQETIAPIYFYSMFGCLLLGFVTATISSGMVNRWVKEPRADQVLSQAMKGFDNKHILLNHTTDVPHVLITQNRILAITTKLQDGVIQVDNNKWRRKFTFSRLLRIFVDEGLGNPTYEAEQNAQKLAKSLQKHLSAGEKIAIEPIIIFTDPKVELTVTSSDIPVLKSTRLKAYIRQTTKGTAINAELRDKLVDVLANGLT